MGHIDFVQVDISSVVANLIDLSRRLVAEKDRINLHLAAINHAIVALTGVALTGIEQPRDAGDSLAGDGSGQLTINHNEFLRPEPGVVPPIPHLAGPHLAGDLVSGAVKRAMGSIDSLRDGIKTGKPVHPPPQPPLKSKNDRIGTYQALFGRLDKLIPDQLDEIDVNTLVNDEKDRDLAPTHDFVKEACRGSGGRFLFVGASRFGPARVRREADLTGRALTGGRAGGLLDGSTPDGITKDERVQLEWLEDELSKVGDTKPLVELFPDRNDRELANGVIDRDQRFVIDHVANANEHKNRYMVRRVKK